MSGALTVIIRHEDETVSSYVTPSKGIQAPFLTEEFRKGDISPVLAYLTRMQGVYEGIPNEKVPIGDGIVVIDAAKKQVINCQSYTALSLVHHFEIGLGDLKWGGPHPDDINHVIGAAKSVQVWGKGGWHVTPLPTSNNWEEKLPILKSIVAENQSSNGMIFMLVQIGFEGWEMTELQYPDLKNIEMIRSLIENFCTLTEAETETWDEFITELKQEQDVKPAIEPQTPTH